MIECFEVEKLLGMYGKSDYGGVGDPLPQLPRDQANPNR